MLHAASDLTSPISDGQSRAVQRVVLLLDQTVLLFIHFVFQHKFYLLDLVQPKRTKKNQGQEKCEHFSSAHFFPTNESIIYQLATTVPHMWSAGIAVGCGFHGVTCLGENSFCITINLFPFLFCFVFMFCKGPHLVPSCQTPLPLP